MVKAGYCFSWVTVLLLAGAYGASAEDSTKAEDWPWAASLGVLYVHPNVSSPVVHAEADDNVTPVANLSYFVTSNFALHAAAAITRHRLTANGSDLGSVSIVPFNLLAQWHFLPGAKISPYVGVGLTHPLYYNQSGPVLDHVDQFHGQFGAIGELGVNFPVGRRTFVNLDWKHFWAKTDVILKGGPKLETTTLDPDAVTIAYGIRF